jgi:hypothetical protein
MPWSGISGSAGGTRSGGMLMGRDASSSSQPDGKSSADESGIALTSPEGRFHSMRILYRPHVIVSNANRN